ncbi:MAG: MFS transporter, partial [archaeon]|nr:MFS transporter [archaeon]
MTDKRLLGILLVDMAMVMFLQCLNTSILTVALPDIARDLGADVSDGSWLLLSYSLGTCALLLQFVKWANNGRVRIFFLYGTALFILASIDCFLAKDFWTLVALRLVQGLGIALAASTAPIAVVHMLPDDMKGRGLAAMAAGTGVAMVLGPSLGGIMAGFMDWNSIFLVNVPLGLFTLVTAFFILPHEEEPDPSKECDLWGAVFWFMAVAGSIVFLDGMSDASMEVLAVSGGVAAFGIVLTV